MGKVLQFKRKSSETAEGAVKGADWTSTEIGIMAQDLLDRAKEGELLGEGDLAEFLILVGHLHGPSDLDQETGLPEEPVPGVKYDPGRNEITLPWK